MQITHVPEKKGVWKDLKTSTEILQNRYKIKKINQCGVGGVYYSKLQNPQEVSMR